LPFARIVTTGEARSDDATGADLRAALAILAERGRARMEQDGRRRCVAINPALLVDRE